MNAKTFEIKVQDDHLARIAKATRPIPALAELIWNAVDADATTIDVTLDANDLGGFDLIKVADNGYGIPYAEAEDLFSRLGGSWKPSRLHSSGEKRILHGKEGKGRFSALSLGRVASWEICAADDSSNLQVYTISMSKDDLPRAQITDASPPIGGRGRGVTVTVGELEVNPESLNVGKALSELARIFAVYLRQNPGIKIAFNGIPISPNSLEESSTPLELPSIVTSNGRVFSASLEIVEWKFKVERKLILCDSNGLAIYELNASIHAPEFNFTAYVKSDYFTEILASNIIDLADMDPNAHACLDTTREVMRDHFRTRASEMAIGLVEEWRAEEIYPYGENEPGSVVERAEREIFNVLALNVSTYLPKFRDSDHGTKRLQFQLLRQAIERAPTDLARILNEVLDLPADKRQELSNLLDHTTLAAIISASRLVADRIDFLSALETLVYEEGIRERVRERAHLHRIVAENAWMFGEQYHLSVDDQSLNAVLKEHLKGTGEEIEIDEPVLREDGSRGIVDLMFSRKIQLAGTEGQEHLVVELKRPSIKIDSNATQQIKSYAFAVADHPRFRSTPAKWVFWAVSNDIDRGVQREASQKDRPNGILFEDSDQSITIWVKTWNQIINDCRSRLQFLADNLQYTPDRDSSLEHLKSTYPKYVPDLFRDGLGPDGTADAS